ncbi:hypothetical protein BH24PSE1_BH24PSE1_09060 [soil metagenome]
MNSTTDTNQDPAEIERDIRRTQEDMSRTVDKIGDQLTMRNVFAALLDKADDNDVDARMVMDGARRNPIALGLIAAGTIWLISDKDSKFPSTGSDKPRKPGELDLKGQDVHHRDYVALMSAVEVREGEDPIAYQRRRDTARAGFLMCERKPDEDEHKFRERLDSMTESFRQKRSAWMDSADHARQATSETARQAVSRTQDMYNSNPVVGGILAAAVGAAFASALPITRKEQETLGDLGEKAREAASEQKDQLTSKLREKKDEVVDKADRKLQESGSDGQPNRGSPEFSGTGSPARSEPRPTGGSTF